MKLYCLSLSYKSPTTYRYMRKTFSLPSVRTLQRMFQGGHIYCGFVDGFFQIMQEKVSRMPELHKYCTLSLDEMSIKAGLSYNSNQDCMLGFENYGTCSSQNIGKQALAFMVSGLFAHWKQPLGFFISKSSTPAEILRERVLDCVSRLCNVGLKVNAVVSDQGASNQKMVKYLQVTVEKPYFMYGERKIFVFFDPPHLLKSIRNNLKMHDFSLNGHRISWKHIESVYNIDKQNVISMKRVPKLTAKHIDLPPFSKMKVKRAAQTLSHTMYAGIMSYICSGEMNNDAYQTAVFIKNIDTLFDLFNSTTVFDPKLFKCALKDGSPSFEFLKTMLKLFEDLKVLDVQN